MERYLLVDGKYQQPDIVNRDETLRIVTFPELGLNLWEVFDKEIEKTT